jgi:hypothetical protein
VKRVYPVSVKEHTEIRIMLMVPEVCIYLFRSIPRQSVFSMGMRFLYLRIGKNHIQEELWKLARSGQHPMYIGSRPDLELE